MAFPEKRLRRLRQNKNLRELVREVNLTIDKLIYPIFISYGKGLKSEIEGMPGYYRYSIDIVFDLIERAYKYGINKFMLFGVSLMKDKIGRVGFNEESEVVKALYLLKKNFPEFLYIANLNFTAYTEDGEIGWLKDEDIDNELTLIIMREASLVYAQAGADIIAPATMMDGSVLIMREYLDIKGFENVAIMPYSVRFKTALNEPFERAVLRERTIDKSDTYLIDYHNFNEAMLEIEEDVKESADIVLIEPAILSMDVIRKAKENFKVPIATFISSGTYSMIKYANKRGVIKEDDFILELHSALRRAGADMIVTYFALNLARILK